MLHSVRARLVISFTAISLVVVGIVGGGSLILVRHFIELREAEYLRSNADAVARQAFRLMVPVLRPLPLLELAQTAAFMSDSRVRVLDHNRVVLADSGPVDQEDTTWVQLVATFRGAGSVFQETLLVPLRSASRESVQQSLELLGRVAEMQATLVRRSSGLFGSRIEFADANSSTTRGYPESTVSASADDGMRNRYLQPIGNPQNPIGFIEVARSPGIPGEAVDTLFAPFAIAALVATVLAAMLGLVLGRRLTAPVVGLTSSAVRMGTGDLGARAPAAGRDEIGELGRQFNAMAARLETTVDDLRQERDVLRRFIADASHELRTPVTALKTFNELLREDVGRSQIDDHTRADFLRESGQQIDRMEWIVENLLNLSRLEAGVAELRGEWTPLADLMARVAGRYERIAANAGNRLQRDVRLDGVESEIDPAIMEIAVGNIISNAVRYSGGKGEILLTGRLVVEPPTGGDEQPATAPASVPAPAPVTALLTIRDRGPGIDEDELPHIFDRFYSGRTAGGSGLGLAISRAGIAACGGELSARNSTDPGWGAEFQITLPARRAAAAEHAAAEGSG